MRDRGPVKPQLEAAFTITADIAPPLSSGPGPLGERLHIAILGGTVAGPRLNGVILPGGSDWPLIQSNGTSRISAFYTIRADDGTPILVRNEGLRVSSPEVLRRLRSAGSVSPDDYYFRSTPRFEAPEGSHGWLNETIFVASLMPLGQRIVVDVFAVR